MPLSPYLTVVICSLSLVESCMKHYLHLFLYMAARDLGLRLYRWDRRMDRLLNDWIRELCGVKNSLDERIDEDVLRWFGHVEKMKSERIAK